MPIQKPVTPECRYGHGPLGKADAKGDIPEWALMAGRIATSAQFSQSQAFFLTLYVCEFCGYCELFDLDPEKTHKETVSK